jgi:hypothetical protein
MIFQQHELPRITRLPREAIRTSHQITNRIQLLTALEMLCKSPPQIILASCSPITLSMLHQFTAWAVLPNQLPILY